MARLCTLSSPLGDALLFSRMQVAERMSSLFVIQLETCSLKGDIKAGALLGKAVTVKVEYDDGASRHFNGFVSRFSAGSSDGRYFIYHLTVHPWLWFLSRTSDCRIFQDQAVPKIVDAVLSDEPTKAVDDRLADAGKYERWEYCVQYRETDLNFVSRLMEQEGIFYFFEHSDGAHKLVLADSKDHAPIAGNATIRFVPDSSAQTQSADHVVSWTAVQEIRSGQYVIDDYDFKAPGNDLQVVRRPENTPEHSKASYEVFDYPGEYDTPGEGESYVASRIEELHNQAMVFEGSGVLRQFHAGRRFKLVDHPRQDQNGEYLIVSVDYDYVDPPLQTGEGEGSSFHCSFSAIPLKQQFRPPRTTPRPLVQGIQTAVVAGPEGEEIHTDEFGRIKVKFHWDRAEERNERSSCWLRVAFLAAGPRFGFVSIPRIGHEVVVDFLEGDPDRPLVTGVVYNGDNLPPWALPANKTQSGLLTRSSLGGSDANANAIRFEDKMGEEQVWLHAEKNQDIEVENDETHWVGHDRKKNVDNDETTVVGHDRTETVGNNETIAVVVDRNETVGNNESVSIGANRTHTVGASETWTVALQRTRAVGINESVAIGAAQEIAVGAMRVLAVGANQTTTIGRNHSVSVGSNQSVDVGANQTTKIDKNQSVTIGGAETVSVTKTSAVTVGDGRTTSVGKDDSLTVGKNLSITAADSITLTTGDASITMKKDGTIVIKGKDITVDGSGEIDVKASKKIVKKGSKILLN